MSSPALPTTIAERSLIEQQPQQQQSSLSHASSASSSEEDLIVASNPDIRAAARPPPVSIQKNIANPSPRTPNRVRFALDDDTVGNVDIELGDDLDDDWEDERDDDDDDRETRAPLLTGMTAPSVTMANDIDELLLGQGRPKSNLGMAFMNMSNSIIGAGIIGA
jgi:sodium-coupled neutral amino acid transporter 11